MKSCTFETLEERRLMAVTPWGAFPKLIGMDQAVANHPTITGAGQTIAFIDTGLNYNDPVFGGGIGPGKRVVAGYDFVDRDASPMDSDGHGTGVASQGAATAFTYSGAQYQGVAPGANIVALRVDDGTFGWAKEAPFIEEALQWVIENRVKYNITVVNMSLGKGHYSDPTLLDPFSDELAMLNGLGVFLVAASGNDGARSPATVNYPGADPNVYAVGSINVNDTISTFTERSKDMDVLAPGELVPLVYYLPASNSRSIFQGSGTSFATSYVAGMAALLKQVDSTLTPAEIMSLIQRGGSQNYDGDTEVTPYTGLTYARLNINGALNLAYAERDDAYENNDALGSATAMPFSGRTASLSGLVQLQGDADYYKFTLGIRADVDFLTSHAGVGAGPSVDLLSANGTLIKHLSASDELQLSAGTYCLRVNAPTATLDGTYSLLVSQMPDDGQSNQSAAAALPIELDADGHGEFGGMILLGGVADYFSVTFHATKDAVFSLDASGLSGGQPTAQLLDADGNVIAAFGDLGTLERRLAAGRYLIRVSSAVTLAGNYAVGVDATTFVVPGVNGSANSIAYDAAGTLHLAYFDEVSRNLKYATRSAQGVWANAVVVDGGVNAGQFPSLMVDALGRPAIAYYDAANADLKYARFDGSSWSVQTVDGNKVTGYYPSLQLTKAGQPVISYYSKSGGDLKLASGSAAGWTIGLIDAGGDVGRFSSLALNPTTGRWAVSYEDTGHGWFKYAEQGKSTWLPVVVDDTTRTAGGFTSLKFNPLTKRPEFSYYDAYNANLKLAIYTGTRWATQVVHSKNVVGLFSNLHINEDGTEDILYYARNSDTLMRATGAGGGWTLTAVATGGGANIARAFDADGAETIAYQRADGLALLDE